MTSDLTKFRALTRVFDPIYRPVDKDSGGPGPSYVPEAHEDFRKYLEASLALNDNAKLLLAGQPGCGKTTLLLSVADRLRSEGRIVAFVDLEVQTAVQDLGSAEMHLAATAELLREADLRGVTLSKETLAACGGWLRPITGDDTPPASRPGSLANEMTRFLNGARESASLRQELRAIVREGGDKDPLELMKRVLLEFSDRRPVVILDGLDKLPPDQARDFFLNEKKKPMTEAPCAAILTIPLSIIYEPTFNVLSERYNNADSAVLPAIRLYDFDGEQRGGKRSARGFDVLHRIVAARVDPIDPSIVMPSAVDKAIEGSGGNIRELARLLQASIVKASVRGGTCIEPLDVEAAIADQRESYRRAFQPRFLPVLKKVRDEAQLDNTDDVGKLLLYGLWVVEYRNGSIWYRLPMPIEQLLQKLEMGK